MKFIYDKRRRELAPKPEVSKDVIEISPVHAETIELIGLMDELRKKLYKAFCP
jgi:hypothetical protein